MWRKETRVIHSTLIPHTGRRRANRSTFAYSAIFSFSCLAMSLLSAHAQMMQPRSSPAAFQAKPSAAIPTPVPTTQPAQTPSLLQQPPTQATIENTSGTLKISAENASLTQTLQRIAEKTGMQIDGVTGDERVFGTFGPGDPRDVLNTLLQGTSYNVIMVGKLESGLPRELLLSQRTAASTGIGSVQQPTPPAEDDNADVPSEDAQPVPPPGRPMGGPGSQNQPHSPQELLQQLREQQQLQQQQNSPQ